METSRRRKVIGALIALCLLLSPLSQPQAQGATNPDGLTRQEESFLKLVKEDSLSHLKQLIMEADEMASCFRGGQPCSPEIESDLEDFHRLINSRNSEYRRLTGLIQIEEVMRGRRHLAAIPGFPKINLEPYRNYAGSEMYDILRYHNEDNTAAEENFKEHWHQLKSDSGFKPLNKNHEKRSFLRMAQEDAHKLYQKQVKNIILALPILLFIDKPIPDKEDVAKAFEQMKRHAKQSLEILKDESKTELIQFANFQANVNAVLSKDPSYNATYESIRKALDKGETIVGWIKANYVRLGSSACVFVSSVMGAWPVAITCGTVMLGHNAYTLWTEMNNYEDARMTWIAGLSTFKQLNETREQVLYEAIMLGLTGQGYAGLVKSAQGPIIDALRSAINSLKSQFTQNLRTGTVRYGSEEIRDVTRDSATYQATHLPTGSYRTYEEASRVTLISLPGLSRKVAFYTGRFMTYADSVMFKKAAQQLASY